MTRTFTKNGKFVQITAVGKPGAFGFSAESAFGVHVRALLAEIGWTQVEGGNTYGKAARVPVAVTSAIQPAIDGTYCKIYVKCHGAA